MSAPRTPAAVAIAAALVLGFLGWWLFSGGTGAGGRGEEEGASAPQVSQSDTLTPAGAGAGPSEPGKAPVPGPRAVAGAEASGPAKPEEWIEGVCVLEDGTPLAGVVFHLSVEHVRNEDAGLHPLVSSRRDGTFRFSKSGATMRPRHDYVELVSAEGATMERTEGRPPALRIEADRLRLTFREKPGWAHVRLVNADTDEPVTNVAGLQVVWLLPGGTISQSYPDDPGLGGWVAIPEGRLPETGGEGQVSIEADLSQVRIELAMPGFDIGRISLKDVRGRMEVRVRPVPPSATGEIVDEFEPVVGQGEFIADPPIPVSARLRWTGPEPEPLIGGVPGLPTRVGKFALYGLGDGPWELEVTASIGGNTIVRGKRAFEIRGSTVDLGKIELKEAGKVVLRVVDAAGAGIPQAWAVVVRPEEAVDQGRRLDLDDNGTVTVGDLEPGVAHRALVKGLPRELEQTVTAETKPKTTLFTWPEKLVACRITLLVDGKAVSNPDGRTTIPAVVQESPLPREKGAWKPDGTFEAKLVPGTYRFSALATPKEGGALALFAGEVTVPSGDSFETRLELQREGR